MCATRMADAGYQYGNVCPRQATQDPIVVVITRCTAACGSPRQGELRRPPPRKRAAPSCPGYLDGTGLQPALPFRRGRRRRWHGGCHGAAMARWLPRLAFFWRKDSAGCADASRLATAVELLFFRIELDRDSFFPACRKRRVFDFVMGLLFSCEDNIHFKFM